MRIACFDAPSGASGDMILGALIDAGCSPAGIRRALSTLKLPSWRLAVSRVRRGGFAATRVKVVPAGKPKWPGVRSVISRARSVDGWRGRGNGIIAAILRAEGKVHGVRVSHAHLHELEDLDTVVDVFGTLAALELMGIERVHVTGLVTGSGSVMTAHGRLPVPAPGTAELLRGLTVRLGGGLGELLTPTGAAILSDIAEDVPPPGFKVERIGCGAGAKDYGALGHGAADHGDAGRNREPAKAVPNILRVFIGEAEVSPSTGCVVQLEAVIDDMNPQLVEPFLARVYGLGALEAWTAPVQMKRNRPAFSLTVLCEPGIAGEITRAFLEETTTLGVRMTRPERVVLPRRMAKVRTRWGPVRVKVAGSGRSLHVTPEFADVAALARRARIPARLVLDEAGDRAAALAGKAPKA